MRSIISLIFYIVIYTDSVIATSETLPQNCHQFINVVGNVTFNNTQIQWTGSSFQVTCLYKTTLEGSSNVTCLKNGSWSPQYPRCLINCPDLPKPGIIFSKESITFVKPSTFKTTQDTRLSLSCLTAGYVVDGPTSIACQSTGEWSPPVPKCKPKPKVPERRWLKIVAIAGPAGIILVILILVVGKLVYRWREKKKQRVEAIELNDRINNNKTYKVWTVERRHKKLITAEDLSGLIEKASSTFNFKTKRSARLVLEEDGTEVTSDSAMILNNDKTFILLAHNQEWTPLMYSDIDKLKLTFDVCTFTRNQRKLFLAGDFYELKEQVTNSFGYDVTCFCLESDGTIIDEKMSLDSVAGQQLMALRGVSDWSFFSTASSLRNTVLAGPFPELDLKSYINRTTRNCFKVWTEDQRFKRVIFAENLVDLHINVARVFRLEPPIELSVLDENVPIIDNSQLLHHKDEILIARETRDKNHYAPSSVYSYPASRNAKYYPAFAEYYPASFKGGSKHRNYSSNTYF